MAQDGVEGYSAVSWSDSVAGNGVVPSDVRYEAPRNRIPTI